MGIDVKEVERQTTRGMNNGDNYNDDDDGCNLLVERVRDGEAV